MGFPGCYSESDGLHPNPVDLLLFKITFLSSDSEVAVEKSDASLIPVLW